MLLVLLLLVLISGSFTKQFTDDIELHRGTIIDLKKGAGYVLSTECEGPDLLSGCPLCSSLLCGAFPWIALLQEWSISNMTALLYSAVIVLHACSSDADISKVLGLLAHSLLCS